MGNSYLSKPKIGVIGGLTALVLAATSLYGSETVKGTLDPKTNDAPLVEPQKDPNPAQPSYENESESLKKARELIKSIEKIYNKIAEIKTYDLKDKETKKAFETNYQIKGTITYTNKGVELSKDASITAKMSSKTFSENIIYQPNIKEDNVEQKIAKITLENENKTKTNIYLVNKDGTYSFQTTITDKDGKVQALPDIEIKQEIKKNEYNTISVSHTESAGLEIFINKNIFIIKNRPDAKVTAEQLGYNMHDENKYSITVTSLCDKVEIPYIVTNNVKSNTEESKDKK